MNAERLTGVAILIAVGLFGKQLAKLDQVGQWIGILAIVAAVDLIGPGDLLRGLLPAGQSSGGGGAGGGGGAF